MMLNDIKVGTLSAYTSIRRGNKKTSIFIIIVLGLIFMNLVFLPTMINGMMNVFVGTVKDYAYGDIVIEPRENYNFIDNADNVLMKINSLPEVKDASKRFTVGGAIQYKQKIVGTNVIGIVPDDEAKVSKYPEIVKEGEFLGNIANNEIMLGAIIAGASSSSQVYDNLGEVNIGSNVQITYTNGVNRTYKVKGIYEGTAEMVDLNVLVNYKELENVLGAENKASTIVVRISDPEKAQEIKNKIIATGIKERVYTWEEKAEALVRQALQSIGSIGTMTKITSLIVGSALIFIVIFINTLYNKRNIGVLKALGITPNAIRFSYILISLFYVISGVFVGLIMLLVTTLYLNANPVIFFETLEVVPAISVINLIQNMSLMILMGIIAGFIPAWFVTREDMLKAIWGR